MRPFAVVAMSGGVDSSVAAALLLEAGHRVEGVSLRLWDSPRRDDRVCSDHRDAARVADHLGIPHTVIDRRDAFAERVVAPFAAAYAAGRTPNPCVACNSDFKFGWLLEWARSRGAERVATGHYARVERRGERVVLRRGADPRRDQSYFLFQLAAPQLARALFPLGEWTKSDVRRRADALGLPVANKLDSQDLCLGDPVELVRARGLGDRPGEVVDAAGRVLARHAGVERFTIGQRRGIGVSSSAPLYVQSIDALRARVAVAATPPRARALLARDCSWIDGPPGPAAAITAQIRHRQRALPARVAAYDDPTRIRVELGEEATAITAGQAVVIYRGDEVVGGGWIERALEEEVEAE